MTKFLFLDDVRQPIHTYHYTLNKSYLMDWDVVTNYDEFVKYVTENGIPEVISFDHDLADEHYTPEKNIEYDKFKEKTGYDCAKWLADYCIDNNLEFPGYVLIHSMNPYGSMNIESIFLTINKVFNKNIEVGRYC
jgi:hypothetical protein